MHEEDVTYWDGETECFGKAYTANKNEKRPFVLVAHAWRGQDDFAREQAKRLADLGYVGVALDNYGNKRVATDDSEAGKLMRPLFLNRASLRVRMKKGFEAAKNLSFANPEKSGAIGFCFGGLSVIELLKADIGLKGAVSFHAALGEKLGSEQAELAPMPKKIDGSLLVLHGAEDPMGNWQELHKLGDEMTAAHADWEIDIYGGAVHAFTNPEVHDKSTGLAYDEKFAKRAFQKMELFFKEILQ